MAQGVAVHLVFGQTAQDHFKAVPLEPQWKQKSSVDLVDQTQECHANRLLLTFFDLCLAIMKDVSVYDLRLISAPVQVDNLGIHKGIHSFKNDGRKGRSAKNIDFATATKRTVCVSVQYPNRNGFQTNHSCGTAVQ